MISLLCRSAVKERDELAAGALQYSKINTPCPPKTSTKLFCQNVIKFPPTMKICGIKMAKKVTITKGGLNMHLT